MVEGNHHEIENDPGSIFFPQIPESADVVARTVQKGVSIGVKRLLHYAAGELAEPGITKAENHRVNRVAEGRRECSNLRQKNAK